MEKFSRKELRQIERADKFKVIKSIIALTLKKSIVWEEYHCFWAHENFYHGNAVILGISVKIECAQWFALKYLNIFCGNEVRHILCPGKYKFDFKQMISLAKESAREEETKKRPKENTTMILPFTPEQKAAENTDRKKLQQVIEFLKS